MGEKGNGGAKVDDTPRTQEGGGTQERSGTGTTPPPKAGPSTVAGGGDQWEDMSGPNIRPEAWADHDEAEVRGITDALVKDGSMTRDQQTRWHDQHRAARGKQAR